MTTHDKTSDGSQISINTNEKGSPWYSMKSLKS